MPPLAVIAPWFVAALATLIARAWLGGRDAPDRLRAGRDAHALAEWDAGDEPLPARVVATGGRLHVWLPRHRRLVLTPHTTPLPPHADSHLDAWRVDVGTHPAALYDTEGTLAQALTHTADNPTARPHRLTLRDQLFLRTPRWTVSALLGCLALGLGMSTLSVAGEHYPVRVDRIITSPEESYDCVIDWPGQRAQGAHVTACPDDDAQRVGDTIDAVRLPASDYVVATDESHLTYVSFLAFAGAAFFAVLAFVVAAWRQVVPPRLGTYAPMPGGPTGLYVSNDSAQVADPDTEDLPHPSRDGPERTALLSPAAWSPLAPTGPVTIPAHSDTWRRRAAWRWRTLPLPWISTWAFLMSWHNLDEHRWLRVPLVLGGIGVIIGILRTARTWVRVHRRIPTSSPRTDHPYVRLDDGTPRGQAPTTRILVFENEASPDLRGGEDEGAWVLVLDGVPPTTGTITVAGELTALEHPAVVIDGVEYETTGPPSWFDVDELEFDHEEATRLHRARSL